MFSFRGLCQKKKGSGRGGKKGRGGEGNLMSKRGKKLSLLKDIICGNVVQAYSLISNTGK